MKRSRANASVNRVLRIANLKPKHREMLREVLEKPQHYVLLTVRGLAKTLGIDPTTTTRIVQAMGFKSFYDFRGYLHEIVVASMTPLDAAVAATRKDGIPGQIGECLAQELRNLQRFQRTIDFEDIIALAKRTWTARQILILGGDLAAYLASIFEYTLQAIGLRAVAATTPGRIANLVRFVGKGDLIFGITFRRGWRFTVEGLQAARKQGAHCVAITDSHASALAQSANECFVTPTDSPALFGSYVTPLAFLNCLVVAFATCKRDHILGILKTMDQEYRTGLRWYDESDE